MVKNKIYIVVILFCIIICLILLSLTINKFSIKTDENKFKFANIKIYQINEAIKNDDIETVQKLIKKTNINELPLVSVSIEEAKDPNYEDDYYPDEDYYDNKTPLSEACYYGNYAIAKLLIDNGADVNYQDETYKKTPLMYAIDNIYMYPKENEYKIVKLLMQNGADTTIKDFNGKTALDYAKNDKKIENLLSLS